MIKEFTAATRTTRMEIDHQSTRKMIRYILFFLRSTVLRSSVQVALVVVVITVVTVPLVVQNKRILMSVLNKLLDFLRYDE